MLIFGTALAAALPGAVAYAEIYRWMDDEGVINYTNVPPAVAQKLEPIGNVARTVGVAPAMAAMELPRAALYTAPIPRPRAENDPVTAGSPSRVDRATTGQLATFVEARRGKTRRGIKLPGAR